MQDYLARIEQLVDKVEDWSKLAAQPLVSVWFITYNHEPYVAQALDSILMQEVDFDYEVVIGEDKSTDRTREIVEDYQRRHPDKIRLRLARENLYSQKLKPGLGVLAACRGQYIALLEGDDYWTDSKKLQKQVDFLEAHPEYVMCFHNSIIDDQGAGSEEASQFFASDHGERFQEQKPSATVNLTDVLPRNFIPTASVLLRADVISDGLPAWALTLAAGDWVLYVNALRKGPAFYLDEVMSVYRRHSGGTWSSRSTSEMCRKMLEIIEAFRVNLSVVEFPNSSDVVMRYFVSYGAAMLEESPTWRTLRAWQSERVTPLQDKQDWLREASRNAIERAVIFSLELGDAALARRLAWIMLVVWPTWIFHNTSRLRQVVWNFKIT